MKTKKYLLLWAGLNTKQREKKEISKVINKYDTSKAFKIEIVTLPRKQKRWLTWRTGVIQRASKFSGNHSWTKRKKIYMLVRRVLTFDTITNQENSYTLGALGNPMTEHPKSSRPNITNQGIVRVQASVKSFHDLLSRYRQNPPEPIYYLHKPCDSLK